MKKIESILIVLLLMLMLPSCSVKSIRGGELTSFTEEDVIGNWISEGIIFDEYMSVDEHNKENNADYVEVLLLGEDGKAGYNFKYDDYTFTDENCTWEIEEEKHMMVEVHLSHEFQGSKEIDFYGIKDEDVSESLILSRIYDETIETDPPIVYFMKK